MATSEIEKLERRYAENPHGLTFAPLAEVHRKNGDITRALELLRIGLELHPNYIPASIVLGRCHQDLGDLPAAEAAFSHVLRLDDENVIALKSLADINERQEKLEDAEQWLRRLVSVDRSNEEAREQLEHIETLKRQQRRRVAAAPKPTPAEPAVATTSESPPAAGSPAASQSPVPSESPLPTESRVTSESPTASQSPPISQSPAATPAGETKPARAEELPDLETVDLSDVLAETETVPAAAAAPPPASPAPTQEPLPADDPKSQEPTAEQREPVPVPDTAPAPRIPGLISGAFEPPSEPTPPLTPLGLEIEVEQDVVLESSGAAEFSVPDATQDMLDLAAKLSSSRPRSPGRRISDKAAAQRLERLEAERREAERRKGGRTESEQADAGRGDAERLEAERAEAQRREAEEIEARRREAEQIEAQRRQAEQIEAQRHAAERLDQERREAEPQVLGETAAPAPRADDTVAPARSYVASETRGQSVAAFFRALLLARPPDAIEAPPQAQAGSLDQDGRTAPPDSTVSFDEFFGSAATDTSPASSGESEPSKEDLDQFQSWLQNLKR